MVCKNFEILGANFKDTYAKLLRESNILARILIQLE